jgi:hypothetical protein
VKRKQQRKKKERKEKKLRAAPLAWSQEQDVVQKMSWEDAKRF